MGLTLDRGFTMHEHLGEMGVIHMNGRIYDPLIGRFMSADPFIQAPENLQSHNRFAYVMNNPLGYTDPSGYFSLKKFLKLVVSVVVAVYAPGFFAANGISVAGMSAATANFINAAAAGFLAGAVSSGNLKGALQGAFTAGLFHMAGFAGTGEGISEAAASQSAARYLAHAAAGCISSVVSGGSCGSGMASALFGKFTSNWLKYESGISNRLAQGVIASIAGSVGAVIAGGKFENGATTAAMGYLFNACGSGRCGSTPEEDQAPTLGDVATDRKMLVPLGVLLVSPIAAGAIGPEIAAALYESTGGMAMVRYTGAAGEAAVGWIGEKTLIYNAAGRKFIADGVTFASVNEVKNVAALSLTPQIRAFGDFAANNGRQFVLWVRSETTFTGPLSRYLQSINAQVRTIPGK